MGQNVACYQISAIIYIVVYRLETAIKTIPHPISISVTPLNEKEPNSQLIHLGY